MKETVEKIKVPKNKEIIGVVIEPLGASRFKVSCQDGHERICRIPGRLKRRFWVKNEDLVLVEPWETDEKERGDIIWKYTKTQVNWLKRKGYLKNI